jgi:hypothetical protein
VSVGSAKAAAFDGIDIDSSTRIIDIIIIVIFINQGVAPRGSRHGRRLCHRRRDEDGDGDDDGSEMVARSAGLCRCLFLFLNPVPIVVGEVVVDMVAIVNTVVSDQQ